MARSAPWNTSGGHSYVYRTFLLVLLVACAALLSCSSATTVRRERGIPSLRLLPPRPIHFEIAQPFPIFVPEDDATRRSYLLADSIVPLLISLDSMGAVAKLTPLHTADSSFADHFLPWLSMAKFEPANIEGRASPFHLPVKLWYRPYGKKPRLEVPLSARKAIENSSLYVQALELNGLSFSRLAAFPSYNASVASEDSLDDLPYCLAEIDLDSLGHPARIESCQTSPFADQGQMLSVINWAEFKAARHWGKSVSSSGLLAVFLFPDLSYPTRPLNLRTDDSLNLLNLMRVRFAPHDIGLLLPPVPRNIRKGSFTPSGPQDIRRARASAWINIDTSGHVAFLSTEVRAVGIKAACQTIGAQLRFYPALDFNGEPQTFRGLIFIEFTDRKTVRIRCEWLHQPDFLVAP